MKSEGTVGCETKCSLHGNPEYSGDSLIKLGWPFIAGKKTAVFSPGIYTLTAQKNVGNFLVHVSHVIPLWTRINENRRADRGDSTESMGGLKGLLDWDIS